MASHWYRIAFDGPDATLEQERMLLAISDAMAARAEAAATKRAAGVVVLERPAQIYAYRMGGIIVWYLDDGALALYRLAGGHRAPEAHLRTLPSIGILARPLTGRYYMLE